MGGGDGGIGGQAGFPLETWFLEMPLCTRWWTTATVLTSALVQCQIVTPFQLFYSFRAVFVKSQVRVIRSLPLQQLMNLVLASPHNFPLLWSIIPGSCLPCLLFNTIFPITGGIIRSIAGPLFVAPIIRNHLPHMPLPSGINAISRTPIILDPRLYMVKAQPRYSIEFSGINCVYSTISSMGVDGI